MCAPASVRPCVLPQIACIHTVNSAASHIRPCVHPISRRRRVRVRTPLQFVEFAKVVCERLAAAGHWADYIDPCRWVGGWWWVAHPPGEDAELKKNVDEETGLPCLCPTTLNGPRRSPRDRFLAHAAAFPRPTADQSSAAHARHDRLLPSLPLPAAVLRSPTHISHSMQRPAHDQPGHQRSVRGSGGAGHAAGLQNAKRGVLQGGHAGAAAQRCWATKRKTWGPARREASCCIVRHAALRIPGAGLVGGLVGE